MSNNTLVREEIYTHQYLWQSGSQLLLQAKADEKSSFWFLLPALLLSFMAYEAFVNFIGCLLLPKCWENEKEYFKGKGLEGKLEAIAAKLPDFSWQKGERSYQCLKGIKMFRDQVAHGRVVVTNYTAERQEDGSHFQFRHQWDKYLSVPAVTQARDDIKSFCQSLVIFARKHSDHPQLQCDAFEGSLASAAGQWLL